jgi:hypothetical protein
MWVLEFGFALRCVALLCPKCVRLHLVCFPGWRPFFSVSICQSIHIHTYALPQHRATCPCDARARFPPWRPPVGPRSRPGPRLQWFSLSMGFCVFLSLYWARLSFSVRCWACVASFQLWARVLGLALCGLCAILHELSLCWRL